MVQGYYFFVEFGLVLIYVIKVYRINSSLIWLRKIKVNSLLAFCFWKACTFSSFERLLCWKSREYSQIYLSGIINYWGCILTLYIMWGVFSLFFVLSAFCSFFLVFFSSSIGVFLDRHYQFIRWDGRGNNYFSCLPLPPANEH